MVCTLYTVKILVMFHQCLTSSLIRSIDIEQFDFKAAAIIIFMWVYCVAVSAPPFLGWGGYAAEGLLLTCSYDYLKQVLRNIKESES